VSRRDLFADLIQGIAALAGAREAKRNMAKKMKGRLRQSPRLALFAIRE
jgi:hypothetical protein